MRKLLQIEIIPISKLSFPRIVTKSYKNLTICKGKNEFFLLYFCVRWAIS